MFLNLRVNLLDSHVELFQLFVLFLPLSVRKLLESLLFLLVFVILGNELQQSLLVIIQVFLGLLQGFLPFFLVVSQVFYFVLDVFVSKLSVEHLLLLVNEFLHAQLARLFRELDPLAHYVQSFIDLGPLGLTVGRASTLDIFVSPVGLP